MMTQIKKHFAYYFLPSNFLLQSRHRRLLSSINNPFFVRSATILDYGLGQVSGNERIKERKRKPRERVDLPAGDWH